MVKDERKKKKFVLPVSFLAIIIFFAIRYDYGLDYWSYLSYYETGRTVEEANGVSRGTGEIWFYFFMNLFPKFSYFIIAHTVIIFGVLYFVTKKYLPTKYYPLFFFLIMTMSTLSFNWISALRSTMAAAVLWIALDYFYIQKKRWLPYAGMIVIASLFHTSALVFFIVPLVDLLVSKLNPLFIFGLLVVGLISTLFYTESLYEWFFSTSTILGETYKGHLGSVSGYSIFGVIHNSLMLFPFYYIVTRKDIFKGADLSIYVLAVFIMIVWCFRLDFHGRMSAYLFVYVIFALAQVLHRLKKQEKTICIVPLLVWCFYTTYLFYMELVINEHTVYSDGNYLHYHTIFEQNIIP
jgi:hypothetical protein